MIKKHLDDFKSGRNVVYSCKYHIIFCPKYRRKVLTTRVEERFVNILREVCEELQVELIEFEVMPDHVHLLVEIGPQYGINKLVRHLKGRSSNLLRKEFPSLKSRIPSLWTSSYFVSTVGGASLTDIKKYIENQKGV